MCSAAAIAASSAQFLLPKPTGLYQAGRSVAEVADKKRTQPFAPEKEPRRLMISVFYPVVPQHSSVKGAYMPPETALVEDLALSKCGLKAPNGTFENVSSTWPARNQPKPSRIGLPATIRSFSSYRHRASRVSSATRLPRQSPATGYTVITIDGSYDVDVVAYPDGSIATYKETFWDNPYQTALAPPACLYIQTQVEDVSFVLDLLSNNSIAHNLVPNLPTSGLNTTHTAMFGDSLDGATAFSVLEADASVLGGLNIHGGL